MARVAIFVSLLATLYGPSVAIDKSESPQLVQELSGEWKGTINGALQGSCGNAEGVVHKVTLVIEVNDSGRLTATSDSWVKFHPMMMSAEPIIGQLYRDLKIVGYQVFTFLDGDSGELVKRKMKWEGELKRKKKKLKLNLSSAIRVNTSTSTACTIYGTYRLSMPR